MRDAVSKMKTETVLAPDLGLAVTKIPVTEHSYAAYYLQRNLESGRERVLVVYPPPGRIPRK